MLAVGVGLAPGTAGAAQTTCEDVEVPVSIGLLTQSMHGRLCVPRGATTVQVLVPGGTYNSAYWDIGYAPESRSYRLAMSRAGIATVATTEAVAYRDVDGVVITGLTHRINLPGAVPVFSTLIPSLLDRDVAEGGLGYLTTVAGTRYSSFHRPGATEPGAIAFDEATKDVVTATETVGTVLIGSLIPVSRRITVPVMLVMGGEDGNFCGPPLGADCSSAEALRVSEGRFYAPEARLSTHVVPGYGHSLNFSANAPGYHRAVVEWTKGLG
ncbi:alpha/beta hydrolase [Saccharothrix sp. MB29]|nr:alpha/beta hydrolase [Saccharothrix sp. MB29]